MNAEKSAAALQEALSVITTGGNLKAKYVIHYSWTGSAQMEKIERQSFCQAPTEKP